MSPNRDTGSSVRRVYAREKVSSWTDLVSVAVFVCCTGVLAAIVWFPLGIGLCLLDRRVRCQRCGESLEDGLCS